ncbi:MAG TPA: hypothetical protein VFZ26_09580 [Gemmatimonadales bacterium]
MKPFPIVVLALALLTGRGAAQQQVTPTVPTEVLAGQQVALIPLTLIAADSTLQSDTVYAPYRDRRTALLWADSIIGEAFTGRAPEVRWVLPPTLRKLARRSPGIVGDPDAMGQALLRSPKLRDIPDPLRSSLRNLMAVAGGRVAMVPAALGFGRDADGRVRADLTLVMADTRGGKVLWRSLATGRGGAPGQALQAALEAALPIDLTAP